MRLYRRFLEIGCTFFLWIGTIALSVIIVAVTCAVFSRKVLGNPFAWTEEVCTLMFICLAFSGACVSTYRKKHIIVDFLNHKFPKETARIITIILNLLIIIFLVLVCIGSFFLLPQTFMVLTVVLDISRSVFFFPLLTASFYIALFYIYDTILIIMKKGGAVLSEGGVYS